MGRGPSKERGFRRQDIIAAIISIEASARFTDECNQDAIIFKKKAREKLELMKVRELENQLEMRLNIINKTLKDPHEMKSLLVNGRNMLGLKLINTGREDEDYLF